jgi:phage tail tape-measure protein
VDVLKKGNVDELTSFSIDSRRSCRRYFRDGANEHWTIHTADATRSRQHRQRTSESRQPDRHNQAQSAELERRHGNAKGSQRKQQRLERNVGTVQSDTWSRHKPRAAVKEIEEPNAI